MLTSRITKTVPIPHEAGEFMKFRRLPGKKLEEAREVKANKSFAMFRAAGAEGIEAIRQMRSEEAEEILKADPLGAYDVDTLLRAGIVGWSYDEKPTPQNIDDLDPETRKWAALEILALSECSEEQLKNSSSESTLP